MAIATGRRNVSTLYQQIQAEVYRQKANDFLTLSPWQGPVVLPGSHGRWQRFRVAERTGWMRKVGRGKVVFSRRLSDGRFLVLVTDDFTLSTREVVAAYRARWTVEVTLNQLKQHLGLGHYQTTSYEGVVHPLHLVCLAHLLLTSLGLQDPGIQEALHKKTMLKLASLGTRQGHLRALIWHDNLQTWRRMPYSRIFIQKLQAGLTTSTGSTFS